MVEAPGFAPGSVDRLQEPLQA